MSDQATVSRLIRYSIAIGALTGVIALGCGVAWLVLGQQTLAQYGTNLMWVGIAVTSLGALMGVGAYNAREDDTTALALTRHAETSNYLRQFSDDMAGRFGCLLLALVEGGLLLVIGTLLGGDPFPSGF
jgi:hypothetical protein